MAIGDHLPRNGEYELFVYDGKTFVFDDLDINMPAVDNTPPEMLEWLRSQSGCRAMKYQSCDCAFYLTPETYLLWKLKWT